MMTITKASKRALRIRRHTWQSLLVGLRERGNNHRESGAFLLGQQHPRLATVDYVAYFDDLEPGALNGAVHLTTAGYTELWKLCRELRAEVLADVHTHPGGAVEQSGIDRDNPLIAQRGHIAIIVPHFAGRPVQLRDVGVNEYLGDDGWRRPRKPPRHGRWF